MTKKDIQTFLEKGYKVKILKEWWEVTHYKSSIVVYDTSGQQIDITKIYDEFGEVTDAGEIETVSYTKDHDINHHIK